MRQNPARVAALMLMIPVVFPGLSGCSSPGVAPPHPPALPGALVSKMEPDVRGQITQAYQTAVDSPSDPEPSGRVGMLLHAYGHVESAADFYRYAMSRAQSNFRWAYYLGLALKGTGQSEEAASSFRQALRLQPDDLPAKLQLATTLIDLNRMEESVPHLEEILERQPGNPLAHYDLGRAFTKLGRADDARESYARACELAPDFGVAQYALALAYRGTGDGDQKRYQHHIALFEKHKDTRPPLEDPLQREVGELRAGVSTHLEKGLRLQAGDRNEEAIAEYRKVLRIRPEHGMAHASLIGLYRHLGRLEEGERQYRAVIEINPDIPEVHYNHGFLLIDQGQPEEAIGAFERAIELNPSYADAHANLAVLLTGSDRRSEAIAHLRKALEIDRNHRLARFNLGRLLLQKGETTESIQLLSGALTDEDSATAAIEALLTTAYAMAGQWAQAETHGRRALALSEKYGDADLTRTVQYDLGKVLVQLGKYREAIDFLRPAAEAPELPGQSPRQSRQSRQFNDDQVPSLLLLLATCYSKVGDEEQAARYAARALNMARRHGQHELAARIEQALGAGGGNRQ